MALKLGFLNYLMLIVTSTTENYLLMTEELVEGIKHEWPVTAPLISSLERENYNKHNC